MNKLFTEPTRINNIFDIFLTVNSSLIEKSSLIPGLSDHDWISVIVVNSKPKVIKQKPRKVYSYHKTDVCFIKSDLNEFSTYFTTKYNSICYVDDMYTELRKNKTKQNKNKTKTSLMPMYQVLCLMVSKKNLTSWIKKGIKRRYRRKQNGIR